MHVHRGRQLTGGAQSDRFLPSHSSLPFVPCSCMHPTGLQAPPPFVSCRQCQRRDAFDSLVKGAGHTVRARTRPLSSGPASAACFSPPPPPPSPLSICPQSLPPQTPPPPVVSWRMKSRRRLSPRARPYSPDNIAYQISEHCIFEDEPACVYNR